MILPCSTRALCLLAALASATPRLAQDAAGSDLLEGTTLTAEGRVGLHEGEGRVVLALPESTLGLAFLWTLEVVGFLAGVVAPGLEVGSRLAQFERHGDSIVIRDLAGERAKRAAVPTDLPVPASLELPVGAPPPGVPVGDNGAGPLQLSNPKADPIDVALSLVETGPVLAAFPIAGEDDQAPP